jgi:hypothetical protein
MAQATDRRLGQDLCIALVLAVIGAGLGRPAFARGEPECALGIVEEAMAQGGLSEPDMAAVRELIALAQQRERAGDEDGAVLAMAEASQILRLL